MRKQFILLTICALISSCTVQKRHHLSGWHIQWNSHKKISKSSQESRASISKEERTPVFLNTLPNVSEDKNEQVKTQDPDLLKKGLSNNALNKSQEQHLAIATNASGQQQELFMDRNSQIGEEQNVIESQFQGKKEKARGSRIFYRLGLICLAVMIVCVIFVLASESIGAFLIAILAFFAMLIFLLIGLIISLATRNKNVSRANN